MPCLLEMTDIRKEFPGVVALDGVDFQVEAGEVHALLGENGAGKSTLIKILAGLYTPDSGEIIFHGERLTGMTPQKVLARGIGFIHQERVHIPYFTVGQMLFLGHEPRKSNGLIDWQRLYEEADAALASTLGAHIDSRLPMQHLSVSEMQLVDITKILMTEPSLIVFDEPTASLSEEEVERLFAVIRNLKERGGDGHIRVSPSGRDIQDLRQGHRAQGWQASRHCRREEVVSRPDSHHDGGQKA